MFFIVVFGGIGDHFQAYIFLPCLNQVLGVESDILWLGVSDSLLKGVAAF